MLFENMVLRVVFHYDNQVLAHLPVPGFYNPTTKTLTVAEGLGDEALFQAAYAILLRRLHPNDSGPLCRKSAREKSETLRRYEKQLIVAYLESRASPLKVV